MCACRNVSMLQTSAVKYLQGIESLTGWTKWTTCEDQQIDIFVCGNLLRSTNAGVGSRVVGRLVNESGTLAVRPAVVDGKPSAIRFQTVDGTDIRMLFADGSVWIHSAGDNESTASSEPDGSDKQ
mmetsp:Transcript_35342/g.86424  ORF Transcript_35342/g.86424 Transcript_35342/m.86424 type:complete len:125 (-) Transcript_35342:432-806(-)